MSIVAITAWLLILLTAPISIPVLAFYNMHWAKRHIEKSYGKDSLQDT